MTDEQLLKLVHAPMTDAYRIIRMTQHLTQDDDKGWKAYRDALDKFCSMYSGENNYGHHLAMAIMAVVDDISKLNKEVEKV